MFTAFLIASFILAVTPGPGVFLHRHAQPDPGAPLRARVGRRRGVREPGQRGRRLVQSLTLGSIFVAIAAATDTAYALAAAALAPALARARGVRAAGRYLTGSAFIGLGVYTVART